MFVVLFASFLCVCSSAASPQCLNFPSARSSLQTHLLQCFWATFFRPFNWKIGTAHRLACKAAVSFFFLYLATQFFSLFFVVPLLLALSVGHALILTWLKSRGLSVVWSWVVGPVAGSDVVCLAAPKYSSECHKSAQHFNKAPYMVLLKIT